MSPPGVSLVLSAAGIREIDMSEVEAAITRLQRSAEELRDHNVDLVYVGGLPMVTLKGPESENDLIEAVAAPETANNAATGGSMVTLLSLGIPPNVTMAILMGAFIIHGIQPGPLLISKYPSLFWGTIASMYIGNSMLLILNLPLIGIWVKILKVPYAILFPLILLLCFIGAYSLNNNIYEIVIMLGFGVFGYLIRKCGFEGAPFLLALVLGPMLEIRFRQSMLYGDPLIFFKRPISAVLLFVSFFLLIAPLFPRISKKRKELESVKEEEL